MNGHSKRAPSTSCSCPWYDERASPGAMHVSSTNGEQRWVPRVWLEARFSDAAARRSKENPRPKAFENYQDIVVNFLRRPLRLTLTSDGVITGGRRCCPDIPTHKSRARAGTGMGVGGSGSSGTGALGPSIMSHSSEIPPERVKDVEKELRGPGNCDAPAAHRAFWLHCLSTLTHLCVCCAGADVTLSQL